MIILRNNVEIDSVKPLFKDKDVLIAIDSSKRNTGITIVDLANGQRTVIEFNGKDSGTSKEDVFLLAKEHRVSLKAILEGAKVKYVGIEDIITKKERDRGKITGMDIHLSRYKITHVFDSFIFFFIEEYGIIPELINNWEWKAAVLPAEYRTREHGKGSLDWFRDTKSIYGRYSDDATDSICISMFMLMKHHIEFKGTYISDIIQMPRYKVCTAVVSKSTRESLKKKKPKQFIYNSSITLNQNQAFMVNNIQVNELAWCNVPIEMFSLSEIYKLSTGAFKEYENEVNLIVWRAD